MARWGDSAAQRRGRGRSTRREFLRTVGGGVAGALLPLAGTGAADPVNGINFAALTKT